MVIDQSQLEVVAKMKAQIHEKDGAFVQPNSHLSYVLSITLPQPTIRIKIPRVLVKVIQRRNQTRSENGENGGAVDNKKYSDASKRKSFRKKVGSMVSNVFGKNKKCSNGDDEDMKRLKKMIESIDMGSEKITTGKSSEEEEYVLNDGVLQRMAVVVVEAEDEGKGKEEPPPIATEEGGNERKERPKSRRTYSKHSSKMEQNRGKTNVGNSNNNNTDITVVCVGEKGGNNNSIGANGVVTVKQGGNCDDLTGYGSKIMSRSSGSSRRKAKIGLSMKKISEMVGGKSKKQELCKKRILMGVRCRPLNHSGAIQYDENGVLIPEINP